VLIIVGVAAGVAVVAYISALITGLQSNTLEKTLGAQAHVTLSPLDDRVIGRAAGRLRRRPRPWCRPSRARSAPLGVELAGPAAGAGGHARGDRGVADGHRRRSGAARRGPALDRAGGRVELDRYDRIVSLRAKVVSGTARLGPGEAIIGRELADDLGVRVGDRLTLVTGGASNSVSDGARVTALVDLGVRELNRRTVIVPLRTAQSLIGLPGGVTNLDLTLADVWTADRLRRPAGRALALQGGELAADQRAAGVGAERAVGQHRLIRAVVMVVVVLGIASVLVVSVVQKRREIGILRAMGATRGQMQRVFLLQGLLVGALGSALGVVLAWG
jgi:lipoprotein-releasing system permease protein